MNERRIDTVRKEAGGGAKFPGGLGFLGGLFLLLALLGFANLLLGPVPLDLGAALRGVGSDSLIFWQIRFPRVLVAAGAGGALGLAGCLLQALFQNPLSDPYILGVSSGAGLGAVAATLLALPRSLGAWAGAMASSALVYAAAWKPGGPSPLALLLSGVAVSSLLGAASSYLLLGSGEVLQDMIFWLLGGFSGASMENLLPLGLGLGFSLVLAIFLSKEMDLLSLGEDSAAGLGLSTRLVRIAIASAATLAASSAVAAGGLIGFVGLVAPHLCRRFVGPGHRLLVPASALGGACLVLAADLPARLLAAPGEIPVGIVTALLGGPFFLYLLRRKE